MKWYFFIGCFLLLGTLTLSSFSLLQRSNSNHDLVFYTQGKHDALWHLALMSAVERSVPPQNPLLDDQRLVGYHYFNDLFWVVIHDVTGISLVTLYLHIAPVVLSFFFCATTLWLFLKVFSDKVLAVLGASITIFGSGFAYISTIFFPASLGGQSVFWLDQPVHLGINQQLLFSLSIINIIFLIIFILHGKFWKTVGVLAGGVLAIKVYAGLLMLGVLSTVGSFEFVKTRKWSVLKMFGVAALVTIPLVVLIGSGQGFPFIWEPGWFFKTMFESGDRLNMPRWEMMRVDAMMHHSWHRLIFLWSSAIVIFFVGNFGVKILGFLGSVVVIRKAKKEEKIFWEMLLCLVLIAFAMPTLFLQKGVVWNTIQFLPYAFVPLGIFLTQLVDIAVHEWKWKVGILFCLLLISLPTTVQTIIIDLSPNSYTVVSKKLIAQIQSLSEYPDKKILLHSNLQNDSLISAFSDRGVYFTDQSVMSLMGNTYPDRKKYLDEVETGQQSCRPDEIFITVVHGSELHIEQCPRNFYTVGRGEGEGKSRKY